MPTRRVRTAITALVLLAGVAALPVPVGSPAAGAQTAAPAAVQDGDTLTLVSDRHGVVEITLVAAASRPIWMVPSREGQGPDVEAAGAAVAAVEADARVPEPIPPRGRIVIGSDDRRQITATTSPPNRAIAQLTMTLTAGRSLCTGFLIDRNTLLTSGHCVHDGGTGSPDGFATDMRITLGRGSGGNPNAAPFGTCRARELLTTPGWIDDAAEAADFGIIQMANCTVRDPGRQTGWFGYYAVRGRTGLVGQTAIVRGYPGFPPTGFSGTMWSHTGRVRQSTWSMAFYRTDTTGGESGSPVYEPRRFYCGPCAMAIHGYGAGHGSFPHTRLNHGPRITIARFQAIQAIAGENG